MDGAVLAEDAGADVEPDDEPYDGGELDGADVLAYDEGLAGVDVPAEADGEADTPEGPWL